MQLPEVATGDTVLCSVSGKEFEAVVTGKPDQYGAIPIESPKGIAYRDVTLRQILRVVKPKRARVRT